MARARWTRSQVTWAVGVGLLLRFIYILATRHFRPFGDNEGYLIRGQYLQAHGTLMPIVRDGREYPDAYWPPVFPATLAVLIELRQIAIGLWFGSHFGLATWCRFGMSVIGALSIAGLALIADRLFGRRVAVATAWIAALFPPMIDVGASLYSESLLVPLIIGATAATIEYRRTGWIWWLITAGGLTGLASLTHSDGVVLVVPLCVAVWPTRSAGARRSFAPLFVLLSTVALVLTPWTIRNAVVFHAFVPLSNSLGNTMAGTYNVQSAAMSPPGVWLVPNNRREFKAIFRAHPVSDPAQDSALIHGALHYIGRHPTYLATVALWNTLHLLQVAFLGRDEASFKHAREPVWAFYLTTVSFWLVFLAAAAGCVTRAVRRAPRWLWLIPALMYLSVVMMGADSARFRSPVDPFLVMLAACALEATAGRITRLELSPPMSPAVEGAS